MLTLASYRSDIFILDILVACFVRSNKPHAYSGCPYVQYVVLGSLLLACFSKIFSYEGGVIIIYVLPSSLLLLHSPVKIGPNLIF
jgi:hypothetical protein